MLHLHVSDAVKTINSIIPHKLPLSLRNVPSMMTSEEKTLLYNLARYYFSDQGCIIDAGIFLGASTTCFAEGLLKSGKPLTSRRKPIRSFEWGICDTFTATLFNSIYKTDSYSEGSNFCHLCADNLSYIKNMVELSFGDITDTSKHFDEPIEILFLDVCKTPTVNFNVTRNFFTKLIPGRSVIVHQDFFFEWLPWIHVTMGHLAPYVEFLGGVSNSAVYLLKEPIPQDLLDYDVWHETAASDALSLFEKSIPEGLSDGETYMLSLAKSYAIGLLIGFDEAIQYLVTLRSPGPAFNDLPFMPSTVVKMLDNLAGFLDNPHPPFGRPRAMKPELTPQTVEWLRRRDEYGVSPV